LEFRNNRVTGLTFGLRYSDFLFSNSLSLKSSVGYSFQREEPEGFMRIGYNFKDSFIYETYVKYHNQSQRWTSLSQHTDFYNSVGVTLGFNDQFNYYLSKGLALGAVINIYEGITTGLEFSTVSQRSLGIRKYKSIFSSNRTVRDNPEILKGNENKFSLTLLWGNNPLEIQVLPDNGLIAKTDYSSPGINSDFDFKRIRVIAMIKGRTFYKELFISPYIQLFVDAGILAGNYGPQHLITPNSALGFYSPLGTFKGLKPYQFSGTEMISLQLEHNWRTIPFQSLGIDFISDLHIDFITGVSGLKIWNDSDYLSDLTMQDDNYWEIYIGLSRIFAFSRIDLSYSSFKKFQVTASIGVLL
jgi:hypothetical protein